MDKEIKKIASEIKPTFQVGKSGITKTLIETIDKYLEAQQIVKIKSFIATKRDEMKFQAEDIAKQTESEVVEIKGFTFVLYRK